LSHKEYDKEFIEQEASVQGFDLISTPGECSRSSQDATSSLSAAKDEQIHRRTSKNAASKEGERFPHYFKPKQVRLKFGTLASYETWLDGQSRQIYESGCSFHKG